VQQFFVLTPILLGVTHAFDADHIAAVSALVAGTDDPRRALRLALVWGIGHMIPLLAVAAVGLSLGVVMPSWVAGLVERSVGVVLLLLGGMTLFGIRARGIHIHAHTHDGVAHVHFHAHRRQPENHHHTHAAVLTGAVHGLAGSAAPMALIPLGAAHGAGEMLLFVAIFGASVAAAMAAYAFGLGRLSAALGDRSSRTTLLVLRGSAGLACMLLGGVWIAT
jgi:hypothetical protein